MGITIQNYPLVIDPLSPAIDLYVSEDQPNGELGKPRFRQLGRVTESLDMLPFTVVSEQAHVFGDASSAAACTFMLTYSVVGRLTHYWCMQEGVWEPMVVSPEMAGTPSRYPSVRMVFLNTSDRQRFMQLLSTMAAAVRKATVPQPRDMSELLLLLGRAPELPRLVDVEKLDGTAANLKS